MNSDQLELPFPRQPWGGLRPRDLTRGALIFKFEHRATGNENAAELRAPVRVLQYDLFGCHLPVWEV